MVSKPVFEGLVVDEDDHPVSVAYVGGEPCYVIDDNGFLRHVPTVEVDRQVLDLMKSQVKQNEDLISDQTSKMLGQEDLFTHAVIRNQLEHIDSQMEQLLQSGIPENGRAYLGMLGFKVVINLHGEVVKVEQPEKTIDDDGNE